MKNIIAMFCCGLCIQAFAQDNRYLISKTEGTPSTGCQVYVQGYVNGDSVSWTGVSKTYDSSPTPYAEGYGTRTIWNRASKKSEPQIRSQYTGEMMKGRRHGKGVNSWNDGRKFVGTFKNNEAWVGQMYQNEAIIEFWDEGKAIPNTDIYHLCGNEQVPDGYAILYIEKNDAQCNKLYGYVLWNISNLPIGSEIYTCSNLETIPSGWVKLSEQACDNCLGLYQIKIKKTGKSSKVKSNQAKLKRMQTTCCACNGSGSITTKIYQNKCKCYIDGKVDCLTCRGTGNVINCQ